MIKVQNTESLVASCIRGEISPRAASNLIKKEGRKDPCMSPGFRESTYYNLMDNFRESDEAIQSYIKPFSFYKPAGGYGAGMRESFDLSLKGIDKVLEIRNINNVVVIDTSEKLKRVYSELKESQPVACITSQFLLQGRRGHFDTIAVFMQKQEGVISLCVRDSKERTSYDLQAIKNQVKETANLILLEVGGESDGEPVASGFALNDCEVFNRDPKGMMKALCLRSVPYGFSISQKAALEKSLSAQGDIIESCLPKEGDDYEPIGCNIC